MKTIKELTEARKSNYAKVALEIKEQEKLWFDFWKSSKNKKAITATIEDHIEYDVEHHYKRSKDQYTIPDTLDDVEVTDKSTGIAYNVSLSSNRDKFDDAYLSAYGYQGKNKNVGVTYTQSNADKVEDRQMRYSTTKSKVLKNIMKQIIKIANDEAEKTLDYYADDNEAPMSDYEFARMVMPDSSFKR